ncbi:O-antigen ligase family protein [Sphingopyxis sp. 2PD]|uniref:O-antigen ligase family protein n=1 Tax=Sphingopyxis sp. 2PD TaxID=2502196 RepID=UPI0010F962CF|nr:O-antigen ligase family protein [Sphingopyxis sp. 2PD]
MKKPDRKNIKPSLAFFGAAAMLGIGILLGGGAANLNFAYLAVIVAGVGCGICLMLSDKKLPVVALPKLVLVAGILVLALPLAQLVPLPPHVWQGLAGREAETAVRALVGSLDTALPMALNPVVNWQLIGALIVLNLFAIAVARLDVTDRDRLISFVLAVAAIEFAIGFVQFSSAGAVFDLFGNSHRGWLLGTFANRNHTGLFFACCVLLSVNLLGETQGPRQRQRKVATRQIAVVALVLLWTLATLGTGSRTGLALTLVALFFVAISQLRSISLSRWHWLGGAALVASVFVVASIPRVSQVLDRYAAVGDDQRWMIWRNSIDIIKQYLPWGAGFGTFSPIYDKHEALTELDPAYINNVHSDFLELVLEAGIPGAVVLAFIAALVVIGVIRGACLPDAGVRRHVLLGGGIVLLIAVHSVVDYPIRRMAMATMFFFGLGLILSQFAISSRRMAVTQEIQGSKS